VIVPLASAHLETTVVTSDWAYIIPTIEGVISIEEWKDATIHDFKLYMRSRIDGSLIDTLSARLYAKNDKTNIYVAVRIFDEDYDVEDGFGRFDGFALLFEDNHTGYLDRGDNGVGCHTWSGTIWYANNDLFYDTSWRADVEEGRTNDGALAWTHTNPTEEAIGDYMFEMMIPLNGTDGDDYDLAIRTLNITVGFKIVFFELEYGTVGVYPDDPTIDINLDEIENAFTFGDLFLSPQPPVGGMASRIIIPRNDLDFLTPLTWLTMFLIAITVLLSYKRQGSP